MPQHPTNIPAYRLYSWIGVFLATACGGILPGLILISRNFRALGQPDRASQSFGIGCLACLVVLIVEKLLPYQIVGSTIRSVELLTTLNYH